MRRFAGLCESFVSVYEGRGAWDFETNGESLVIESYGRPGPATVFDVGANVGDWTRLAATGWPDAVIHSFEPVPTTFDALATTAAPLTDRVRLNRFGLGAVAESREIYLHDDIHTRSSLVSESGSPTVIELRVGDEYVRECGVDRIDFLKIDTEGWDHNVLLGFGRTLAEGRIEAIQFEYGSWALDTKFLLKDFYDLLQSTGMKVGKVYASGVEFGPWSKRLEDFAGLNFLAVRDR